MCVSALVVSLPRYVFTVRASFFLGYGMALRVSREGRRSDLERGMGGRNCGKNVLGGKEVSLRSNVGKYVGAWDSHAISYFFFS